MLFKKNKIKVILFWLFTIVSTSSYTQEIDVLGSTHESWEYALVTTGDILQVALPLAAGLTTVIKKDWKGSKQFTFSFLTTVAVTHSLKMAIKKRRPEGRNDYNSFPSGHTSSAFQGASFIQKRYGWKYGWPAYALAVVVGVSRVEGPDGYHDYWDVFGGAIIGVSSTYIFTTPYQQEHFDLGYSFANDIHLLSFKYKF